MGNNVNENIEGRFVLLREEWFSSMEQGSDIRERVFLARGGFGCNPDLMGNAVIGEFVVDGEQCRVEGYNLSDRFATDEEVDAALAERASRGLLPTDALKAALERVTTR